MPRSTEVRPALVADVVRVMQRRRDHAVPLRYRVLAGRLPRGMYGLQDALRGGWMMGLLDHPDHLSPAHQTVTLTAAGLACDPDALEALTYRWGTPLGQHVGTLERYAREVYTGHSGGPVPGALLRFEECPRPMSAQVLAHVLALAGGVCVYAAGEVVCVSWNGEREVTTRHVPA